MSEKVTFGELIELIANETDNSKKFTHDFLKDFVSVINSGLEDDGRVNIAGFGKFELRQMNEREGYNPQTGEKMTIPAQNKVVFKPYKELRELVNAPYAHLESELIEEDTAPREDKQDEEQGVQQVEQNEQPTDETLDKPESGTAQEQSQEEQKEETAQIDTSFAWDGPEESDELLKTDQTEAEIDEEQDESEDIVAFDQAGTGEEAAQENQEESSSKDAPGRRPEPVISNKKNKSASLWGIAAVIALIVIIAGAWLITSSNTNNSSQQNEPIASAMVQPENENSEQQEPASPETQQSQPSTPAPANTQPQNNQPAAASASNALQQNQQAQQQPEAIEVNEGQTLWSIAENNYDDPYLWPWIYEANKSSVDNPNIIIAGNSLALPVPDLPDNTLSSMDSLEVAIGYVETYRWHKEQETDSAKFYLWAAQTYDQDVFEHIDRPIDKEDLAFVNRVR